MNFRHLLGCDTYGLLIVNSLHMENTEVIISKNSQGKHIGRKTMHVLYFFQYTLKAFMLKVQILYILKFCMNIKYILWIYALDLPY